MAAWDRQPKETARAYSHFTIYRDLGPGRTLENTGKIQGVRLCTLEELSAKWNWVARCDQWDAHLQAIHDRALVTEAARSGRRRARAYEALLKKSERALKKIDPAGATLAQVATAMRAACEGMRLEEGLATAHVSMEMQDARTILSRLPAEFRDGLRRVLEADAHSRANPLGVRAVADGGDSD